MTKDKLTRDEKIRAHATPADYPVLGVFGASPQVTDEQIIHLWETRVGVPTEKYPFTSGDVFAFARALLALSAPPAAEPLQRQRPSKEWYVKQAQNLGDEPSVIGAGCYPDMPAPSQEAKPVAADFEAICRKAWNDHYHKCAPTISYETYRYIWENCIERLDLVTRTEMGREIAALAAAPQEQAAADKEAP